MLKQQLTKTVFVSFSIRICSSDRSLRYIYRGSVKTQFGRNEDGVVTLCVHQSSSVLSKFIAILGIPHPPAPGN